MRVFLKKIKSRYDDVGRLGDWLEVTKESRVTCDSVAYETVSILCSVWSIPWSFSEKSEGTWALEHAPNTSLHSSVERLLVVNGRYGRPFFIYSVDFSSEHIIHRTPCLWDGAIQQKPRPIRKPFDLISFCRPFLVDWSGWSANHVTKSSQWHAIDFHFQDSRPSSHHDGRSCISGGFSPSIPLDSDFSTGRTRNRRRANVLEPKRDASCRSNKGDGYLI